MLARAWSAVVLGTMIGVVVALGLGCAGPGSLAGLSREQIEAMAAIKDASAMCIEATVPMYGGRAVFASIAKDLKGSILIDAGCKVTIDTK